MPTLSNRTLKIEATSDSNKLKVTACVKVNFSTQDEANIKILGLKVKLACKIWSEDSGFGGEDDALFSISTKTIKKDDTYTFVRTVNRDTLDEDWEGNDEIYARFNLAAVGFPMFASGRTGTITGNY